MYAVAGLWLRWRYGVRVTFRRKRIEVADDVLQDPDDLRSEARLSTTIAAHRGRGWSGKTENERETKRYQRFRDTTAHCTLLAVTVTNVRFGGRAPYR